MHEEALHLHRLIARSQLFVAPGAGHQLQLDKPQMVIDAIDGFIPYMLKRRLARMPSFARSPQSTSSVDILRQQPVETSQTDNEAIARTRRPLRDKIEPTGAANYFRELSLGDIVWGGYESTDGHEQIDEQIR